MGIDIASYRACIGTFYLAAYSINRSFSVRWISLFHLFFGSLFILLFDILLSNHTILCYVYFRLILAGDVALNPGPLGHAQYSSNNLFSFCTINCRSVLSNPNKIDHIKVLAETYAYSVIALTETWLDNTIEDHRIEISGYNVIRKDRNSHGGGVALYIKNELATKFLDYLSDDVFESLWIMIKLKGKNVIFSVHYCAQDISENADRATSYLNYLENCIDGIADLQPTVKIMTGDFNAHVLNWGFSNHDNALGRRLSGFLEENSLTQVVNEPTRGTSLLDLIITDNPDYFQACGTSTPLPFCERDHNIVWANLKLNTGMNIAGTKEMLNVTNVNWDRLSHQLASKPWNSFLMRNDPKQSLDNWLECFEGTIKEFIPLKKITIKANDQCWITDYVKHTINVRQRKFKKAKRTNKNSDWETYRRACQDCNESIIAAKGGYFDKLNDQLNNPSTSPKKFWKLIKGYQGKQHCKGIPDLKDGDEIITDTLEKSDLLNTFLAQQCSLDEPDRVLPDASNEGPEFHFRNVNVEEVEKCMKSLNKGKAVGPDGISNLILSLLANTMAPFFTDFFNFSISTGTFPSKWKTSNITPIFKNKGDKSDVCNYRPISLLCCASKVFEQLLAKQLTSYFHLNNMLYEKQAGFQKGDSTVNQLIILSDKILQALEEGKDVRTVFLDMSRAFDRVWHKGLLHKLNNFGVRGCMLDWFQSYLSDRSQRVVLNGVRSSSLPTKAGVPQGSVLGPILFLVYVNDIVENLETDTSLFADDTTLVDVFDNAVLSDCRLQNDLVKIERWAEIWLVDFNPTKTVYMTFSSKQQLPPDANLIFFGTKLQQVTTHRHLGVILQNRFKWHTHVNSIVNSCHKKINILKSLKYKLPRKTLDTLYCSTIRPIIEYGIVVYYEAGTELASLIENIQYKAGLLVTGALKNTSYNRIMNELGWEPISGRVKLLRSTILYKVISGDMCRYFSSYILNRLRRNELDYNLRNRQQFTVPLHRTQRYSRSFIPSSTSLWNNLHPDLKSAPSIDLFKLRFKRAYFNNLRNAVYNLGDRRINIIHTRFRLNFTSLNNDLYIRTILPFPVCRCDNNSPETYQHFFLSCPLYANERNQLVNEITPSFRLSGIITNQQSMNDISPNLLMKILMFGFDPPLRRINYTIFPSIHTFINSTNRFTFQSQ